ncbi:hypothetical protein D3C71_1591220 [compost metagenome]
MGYAVYQAEYFAAAIRAGTGADYFSHERRLEHAAAEHSILGTASGCRLRNRFDNRHSSGSAYRLVSEVELLDVPCYQVYGSGTCYSANSDCHDYCTVQLLCRSAADCNCGRLPGRLHDWCRHS